MTDSSIQTLSAVSEALETYRETTVLNRRDFYIARYEGLIGKYAGATANQQYLMEIPKYVLEATLYLGVLALAIVQFLTKDIAAAASTVAVFLAAGSRVVPALLRLQGAGITIRNSSVSAGWPGRQGEEASEQHMLPTSPHASSAHLLHIHATHPAHSMCDVPAGSCT